MSAKICSKNTPTLYVHNGKSQPPINTSADSLSHQAARTQDCQVRGEGEDKEKEEEEEGAMVR